MATGLFHDLDKPPRETRAYTRYNTVSQRNVTDSSFIFLSFSLHEISCIGEEGLGMYSRPENNVTQVPYTRNLCEWLWQWDNIWPGHCRKANRSGRIVIVLMISENYLQLCQIQLVNASQYRLKVSFSIKANFCSLSSENKQTCLYWFPRKIQFVEFITPA